MKKQDIEEKIIKIIKELLGTDEKINKKMSLEDDLGADSLDKVEIEMEIEDEFDIVFPYNKKGCKTVKDCIDDVVKALKEKEKL